MSLTPAIPGPPRPRESGGFTVVELMVTVAVAAILVAVAVPAFNNFVMTDRDIAQANSLVASFNYARSEAIKQRLTQGVRVCPSDDGATCTGGAAWSAGWVVVNYDPTLAGTPLRLVQSVPALGGNTTVTATGTGATGVTFQPNGGTLGSDSVTITICDPRGAAYARDVEVTATGKVAASQKPGQGVAGNALACP